MNIRHRDRTQLGVLRSLAVVIGYRRISKGLDTVIDGFDSDAGKQLEISMVCCCIPAAEHPRAVIVEVIILIDADHGLDFQVTVDGQITHDRIYPVVPLQVTIVERQRASDRIFITKIFMRKGLIQDD